jgi:hypothetical protein
VYNVSYSFTVRFSWFNVINETNKIPETSELSASVIWLNYTIPNFTLDLPAGKIVKTSAETNRF